MPLNASTVRTDEGFRLVPDERFKQFWDDLQKAIDHVEILAAESEAEIDVQ